MNIFNCFFKVLTVFVLAIMLSTSLAHAQTNTITPSNISFLNRVYVPVQPPDPTPRYSRQRSAVYLLEGETEKDLTSALFVDQEEGVSLTDAVFYFLEIARAEVLDTDRNILSQIENLNTGETLLLFMFNERDKERVVMTQSNGREQFERVNHADTGDIVMVLVFKEYNKMRDEIIWGWTVSRYSSMQTADGKQVLRRLNYVRQHYGNDGVSDFLRAIDVNNPRSRAINAVISAQIPHI